MLIALDHALDELAQVDQRCARVMEMRYFGGRSVEETAAALRVSAGDGDARLDDRAGVLDGSDGRVIGCEGWWWVSWAGRWAFLQVGDDRGSEQYHAIKSLIACQKPIRSRARKGLN